MNDELAQQVTELVTQILEEKGFSAFAVPFHGHTQTDAGQLDASKALINSPQPFIGAVNTNILSTGGSAILSTNDSAVISDLRTKLNLVVAEQKIIGLIKNK